MTPPPPTRRHDFDVAIVGGGFAGSILAQILRQLGRSVLLIERDHHPRWAIGESSTPVANLLLEQLADHFHLPNLRAFARWGTWQATHPHIPCGLKRGFSFYHHPPAQPWRPTPGHPNELLVAASPHDSIADTHWFRPDFDSYLFHEAIRLGAVAHQDTTLDAPHFTPTGVQLHGSGPDGPLHVSTRFLIDASGPRGYLHRHLQLAESVPAHYPRTEAVHGHFTGVSRWADLHPTAATPPFPPDDAALHHVTDRGWMWVLRFNNGITSAGFARVRPAASNSIPTSPGVLWHQWLADKPSVAAAFEHAQPVRPLTHIPTLPFRTSNASGPRWAMLPVAAGFVDPLLSTGFPLTLLGIQRLASLFEQSAEPDFSTYGETVLGDLDITFDLIAALYRVMPDFDTFRHLTMLYFTAAIFSETRTRLGHATSNAGFLLRHHPEFSRVLRHCIDLAGNTPGPALRQAIETGMEPFNLAGLCRAEKANWYPCDVHELYQAAHRIPATRSEIDTMLRHCGMLPA